MLVVNGTVLHSCLTLHVRRTASCDVSCKGSRCSQAMLAVGLLQLRPWKPRFVGFLGTVASLINCEPSRPFPWSESPA